MAASTTPSQVTMKIMVDRVGDRVVFAEAGCEFVDALLSFLTLPVGTVVRLADKQTGLGSIDRLYEAVDSLDGRYMQSEACKEMLLKPRSPLEPHVKNLTLKVDDARAFDFICPSWECSTGGHCLISNYPNTVCGCKKVMEKETMRRSTAASDMVGTAFVKGGGMFLVTDDLKVMPVTSTSDVLSMLKSYGLPDDTVLEERCVTVTRTQVSNFIILFCFVCVSMPKRWSEYIYIIWVYYYISEL